MPDPGNGVYSAAVCAALEEDGAAFLGQIIAEVESPLDGSDSKAALKAILDRLGCHKDILTKAGLLYEFDRLALETASEDEVIAHAPGLYRRYCLERGQAIDPHDQTMNPPAPGDPKTIKALRARVLEILRTLHWSYAFGPIRERNRVSLIKMAMLVMVAATVIMGVLVAIFRSLDQPFLAMLVSVVYAGVMGGAVSCARRLGDVSTTDDALGSIYALKNSRYVLIFAPMTGAVFAVVTLLLFMGKLMTGSLFPAFAELTVGGPANSGWAFTRALLPTASSGYALLFLWCFIAGFAERFIPDTLDALTKRAAAQKADGGKEGTPATR